MGTILAAAEGGPGTSVSGENNSRFQGLDLWYHSMIASIDPLRIQYDVFISLTFPSSDGTFLCKGSTCTRNMSLPTIGELNEG
ncbi:hypothetical protein Bpfe_016723, partial [Biomphalaria pfeifferi]